MTEQSDLSSKPGQLSAHPFEGIPSADPTLEGSVYYNTRP